MPEMIKPLVFQFLWKTRGLLYEGIKVLQYPIRFESDFRHSALMGVGTVIFGELTAFCFVNDFLY